MASIGATPFRTTTAHMSKYRLVCFAIRKRMRSSSRGKLCSSANTGCRSATSAESLARIWLELPVWFGGMEV